MMWRMLCAWVALVVGLAGVAIRASEANNRDAAARGNVASRTFALPNGFRCVFVPRPEEARYCSLRLVVRAGSLDEQFGEQGYAHFVEHMAFNGTAHYPPGALMPVFRRLGLGWGADVNAHTSFSSTVYKLDLPSSDAPVLAEAIRILADFAGAVTFPAEEVVRERSVVLSELASRDGDDQQVRVKLASIYYAGSSLPDRFPLGDPTEIKRVEAPQLMEFYRRCYRPERMTLIVIGNLPEERVRQLIAPFGELRAEGPSVEPVAPTPPQASALSTHVVIDPLATATTVSVVAVLPVSWGNKTAIEARLGAELVIQILDRRLRERRMVVSQSIGRASAFQNEGIDPRFMHYVLQAAAAQEAWSDAVTLLETELRRVCLEPTDPRELREAVDVVLWHWRTEWGRLDSLRTSAMADALVGPIGVGEPWQPPRPICDVAEAFLPKLTPDDVRRRAAELFVESKLRVIVTPATAIAGGDDAVMAAYRASASRSLSTTDAGRLGIQPFAYREFGPAGGVEQRDRDPVLGIERVRFANGVRLNVRASTDEPHLFRMAVRFGRGTADIPRDRPGIGLLGMALLSRVDCGKHAREQLQRHMELRGLWSEWTFGDNDLVLELGGGAQAVTFALQYVTALVSDAKLDAAKWREAQSWYPALARSMLNSTVGYARLESMIQASGDDPRIRLPRFSDVQSYPFDEVASWVRSRWLDGPIEIGLVGEFVAEEAITAAAKTVGTLTPRRVPSAVVEPMVLRTAPRRHLDRIHLPDKTAAVRFYWPTGELRDPRIRRTAQISVTALEAFLWRRLRQELGVTYSPTAFTYVANGQPDFGFVGFDLTLPPEDAKRLSEATIRLINDFSAHGLVPAEFEGFRAALKERAASELHSNSWWLRNVLIWAQTNPAVLDEARVHQSVFDEITLGEVNRYGAGRLGGNDAHCVGFIPSPVTPFVPKPVGGAVVPE